VPPGGYVDVSRLKVEPISFTEARRFVVEHHYAGTYPSDVWRVGAFQQGRDGHFRLVGVCVFSTHVNPATSARWVKAAIDPDELLPERPPVPDLAGLTPAQQARVLAKAEQQRQRENERIKQRRELAAQQAAGLGTGLHELLVGARIHHDARADTEGHVATVRPQRADQDVEVHVAAGVACVNVRVESPLILRSISRELAEV
jgi:hypothetical protein